MKFEITDIGGGIIEVVTREDAAILSRRLIRKTDFREVEFQPSWDYVSLEGVNPVQLKFQDISKIGSVDNPVSNQAVYDAIKILIST